MSRRLLCPLTNKLLRSPGLHPPRPQMGFGAVSGDAWGLRWHLWSEATPSRGSSRLGGDEGRNPIPLLARLRLNLEHGSSARAFFHLKPNLILFVRHGAMALRLAGQWQLLAAAAGGVGKAVSSSVPLRHHLPPHFTQAKDWNLSLPRTSVTLQSLREGTRHPQPQPTAPHRSFDLLADPPPRSPAQGELACVHTVYI